MNIILSIFSDKDDDTHPTITVGLNGIEYRKLSALCMTDDKHLKMFLFSLIFHPIYACSIFLFIF